ncbi:MAG: hypothetical protein ACE5LU_08090 [Anaerolineae bacterium]
MPKLQTMLAVVLLAVIIAGGSVTYAVSPAMQPEPPRITVSGVIVHDTGSAIVPAQGLLVKLIDYDTVTNRPGETLGEVATDEFGRYSFTNILNNDVDGPERRRANGQDVQLLIQTDNDRIAVQRHPQTAAYAWASVDSDLLGSRGRELDVSDGEHVTFPTIQFDDDVRDFQAVRAFVALNRGWTFMAEETGLGLAELGRTEARWPVLSTSERGYDPNLKRIMLGAGDADSPDAVLHLQAHAFMDNVLRNLGGAYPQDCAAEEPIDVETSQTCAWIHGFGMFFAAEVQDDPIYVTASEALNLESPLVDLADGDSVSARVAGALLDLVDANPDGFDQYMSSFSSIWDAFASAPQLSFRDLWDTWAAMGAEDELRACEALPSLFQNTINYNTPPELDPFPDPVEMDEDPDPPPAFNMHERARDAECPFEALLFDVDGSAVSSITVELREDGYLEIIPAQDWHGDVTLDARVFDGTDYVTQTLHVVVHSVNDAPRIAALPDRTVKVGHEIVYQLENSISDPDHPKDSLTLNVVPAQATLVPPLDVSIEENFIVRFVPQDLTPGTNAMEIVVTDPEGAAGRHTLLLTWEQLPNQVPTIGSTIPLVWEAHKGQNIEMDLLTYATDDRDEPSELSWCVDFDTMDNATVSGCGTQKLIFTPDPAGFLGDDEITLVVQDRDGAVNTVDVILRWTPLPNIVPTINPPIPDFATGINQQLVVDLRRYGHDQDDNDEGLRWYVKFVDPGAPNPFVSGQGTQKLTFTPVLNFEGTIEALFVVRDPKGAEASQLVNLTWQKFNVYMSLILRPFQEKPTN